MFKTMRKANVKGFSLVELMVVVAIIGILAAVAIPNFQRFQRKARQSEAKSLLGGIHSAEAAFHGQWEHYLSSLDTVGFVPTGQLRYNAGFVGGAVWSGGMAPLDYTGPAPSALGTTAAVCGAAPFNTQCMDVSGQAVAGAVNPNGGTGNAARFTAGAQGDLGGAMTDIWTITEAKVVMNTQDGTL